MSEPVDCGACACDPNRPGCVPAPAASAAVSAEWAYRALLDGDRVAARIEVGQALWETLKAEHPHLSPPVTLLGVPLTVAAELEPMGWRTFDQFGHQMRAGEGL